MSKLRYSKQGYRRRMQMSKSRLFVFVEGSSDRYVYSKIVDYECLSANISYEVVSAEELPKAAGGKQALLQFFDYLRRSSSLIDNFSGKKTASIFFLDKDVEDLSRRLRRSQHIVYTETYEIENYLFIYGDIVEAAASTAGLDIGSMRSGIGDAAEWRSRAAEQWKEWVAICLYSQTRLRYNLGFRCYRKSKSEINEKAYGDIDRAKQQTFLGKLQESSGLSSVDFQCSFNRLRKKVNQIFSNENYDKIFKGKWYCCFLVEDIDRIAGRRRKQTVSYDGIITGLAQTLDYHEEWTSYFRNPIRNILAQI